MATYRTTHPDSLRSRLVDMAIGFTIGTVLAIPLGLGTVWWVLG